MMDISSKMILLLIAGTVTSCFQTPSGLTLTSVQSVTVTSPPMHTPTSFPTTTLDIQNTSTPTLGSADGIIEFAGRTWNVKSGCGLGPGPNCWSNNTESVWVQDEALHLKIRKIGDKWYSAEVSTVECTQYGMHRFFVSGDLSSLDKNVVAAPFLYKDDQNEIDMEFSKWAEENPVENVQYVIQPWDVSGNIYRFPIPQDVTESTHSIDWEPSSIHFISIRGYSQELLTSDNLLDEWEYKGNNIPTEEGCLRVHINLWQVKGNPPSDGREVELVISDAQFPAPYQPPPTPIPPTPIPTTEFDDAPWIKVTDAESNYVSGIIGPGSYCNDNYRVVFYAKTDTWYVQPYTDNPITQIDPASCHWESLTHPWDNLAAFLVPRNYDPPDILSSQSCPPELSDSEILASTCFNP